MPKKQTLTVAEWKSLLLARFNVEQTEQAKLLVRLQQEFGEKVEEENPKAAAINNKLANWISAMLARRLTQNRRSTPLISSRDFVRFIPSMMSEISKTEGGELEAGEHKMFEKFLKLMFENIFEMVHTMVPPRKNPYEEYWRWATTVLDLAAERGVLPTELLALEGATDEITRRMFTKKQFVALSKRAVNKFVDADVLKKIVVQPMLDMIARGDEEERRELEKELEAELMPQLRERVEKTKVVINTWLGEKAECIYVAA